MLTMGIGEDIKRLREERGLGVNQLGKLAGVSGSAISCWENGKRRPWETEQLCRVLNFLGAEIHALPRGEPARRQIYPTSVSEVRTLMIRLPYMTEDDVGRIMREVGNTTAYNREVSKTHGREEADVD